MMRGVAYLCGVSLLELEAYLCCDDEEEDDEEDRSWWEWREEDRS